MEECKLSFCHVIPATEQAGYMLLTSSYGNVFSKPNKVYASTRVAWPTRLKEINSSVVTGHGENKGCDIHFNLGRKLALSCCSMLWPFLSLPRHHRSCCALSLSISLSDLHPLFCPSKKGTSPSNTRNEGYRPPPVSPLSTISSKVNMSATINGNNNKGSVSTTSDSQQNGGSSGMKEHTPAQTWKSKHNSLCFSFSSPWQC